MSRYNRLADTEESESASPNGNLGGGSSQILFERPSSDLPATTPLNSTHPSPQARGSAVDGVFARLSRMGRPTPIPSNSISGNPNDPSVITATNPNEGPHVSESGKMFEEIEPPSYVDTVHENAPPYFETTVVTTFDGEGDVLIEGLPVGNYFIFISNMIISMSFDFIGFMLTALLATSHAARYGSRAGLGVTLIRYGMYIKNQDVDDEMAQYRYYNPDDTETREEVIAENYWTAYIFLIIGFFLILKSNAEFVRARRMRAAILSGVDQEIV